MTENKKNLTINDIMNLSKENLSQVQHTMLKEHALEIWKNVGVALRNDDYTTAREYLNAGNVSFKYEEGPEMSMETVIQQLEELKADFADESMIEENTEDEAE